MKKKIFALVLCLVLCLPLVLTACGKSFVTSADYTSKEDKTTYTKTTTHDYDGVYSYGNGKLFVTTESTFSGSTCYRVYNALTGAELFEEDAYTNSSYSQSYSISLASDNLFVVTETTTSYFSSTIDVTYTLYNENGNSLMTAESGFTFVTNLGKEAFIADNVLYFYENGSTSVAKRFYETQMRNIITSLVPAGDNYVYVDGKEIFVFNSNFEQIAAQTLKVNSQNFYAEETTKFWILNNGNVLVQTLSLVGPYADVYDDIYDVVVDGECYVYETYLYKTEKLSYKELKLDYIINDVTTADAHYDEYKTSLFGDAENMAFGVKVDDEMLIYDNNNQETATIFLSNDGKVSELDITDCAYTYTSISDTRYVVSGAFFTRVYDKKDKLIGEIGALRYHNKNFIVTDEAIYKTNALEEVVKLDEDTRYYGKTVDSIIYKEVESDEETYYLVNESGVTKEIATNDFNTSLTGGYAVKVMVNDYFYAIQSARYAQETVGSGYFSIRSYEWEIYQTNGTLIDSFNAYSTDLPAFSLIGEYEDSFIASYADINDSYVLILSR